MNNERNFLNDARNLAVKYDNKLSVSNFFAKLGRGQHRDNDFGGWNGLPDPCDHDDFFAENGFVLVQATGRHGKLHGQHVTYNA